MMAKLNLMLRPPQKNLNSLSFLSNIELLVLSLTVPLTALSRLADRWQFSHPFVTNLLQPNLYIHNKCVTLYM